MKKDTKKILKKGYQGTANIGQSQTFQTKMFFILNIEIQGSIVYETRCQI